MNLVVCTFGGEQMKSRNKVDKSAFTTACVVFFIGFVLVVYGTIAKTPGFTIAGGFTMLVMFATLAVAYHHERFPSSPTY